MNEWREFLDRARSQEPRVSNRQATSFDLSLNGGWTVDARILRIGKQEWIVQVRGKSMGGRKSRRSALRAVMRELNPRGSP